MTVFGTNYIGCFVGMIGRMSRPVTRFIIRKILYETGTFTNKDDLNDLGRTLFSLCVKTQIILLQQCDTLPVRGGNKTVTVP